MITGIEKDVYKELGLPLAFSIDLVGFSKVILPCLCQPKYDGELAFAVFDEDGEVYLFNKAKYGRFRTGLKATAQLKKLGLRNTFLMGELHYGNNFYGGFLRNKFNDDLEFACFQSPEKFNYPNAYTIEEQYCKTIDEVKHYFDKCVKRGFEGIVAKPNSNYGTWVKIKQVHTSDLLCLSADPVKCRIGLGLKPNGAELCGAKVRANEDRQALIGKIIEIEHRGLIYTDGKLTGIRNPVFKGVRENKRVSL
jgi:hypothetical protein